MKVIREKWKLLVVIKVLCFVSFLFLYGCNKGAKHRDVLQSDLFTINVNCPRFERWTYNIKYECKIRAWGKQAYYYFGYNYSQDTYDFQFYRIDTDSNYIVRVHNFNGHDYKAFYIRWKGGISFGNTDTLTSNLDYYKIKAAYPYFRGKINILKINSIKIDTLGFIPSNIVFPIELE